MRSRVAALIDRSPRSARETAHWVTPAALAIILWLATGSKRKVLPQRNAPAFDPRNDYPQRSGHNAQKGTIDWKGIAKHHMKPRHQTLDSRPMQKRYLSGGAKNLKSRIRCESCWLSRKLILGLGESSFDVKRSGGAGQPSAKT